MWRVSAVSEDWVDKGCHIHIDQIELSVRPDHSGGLILRKVFSSTTDADFDVASRLALGLMAGSSFRQKLRDSIERAMTHMLGITGYKMVGSCARSGGRTQ